MDASGGGRADLVGFPRQPGSRHHRQYRRRRLAGGRGILVCVFAGAGDMRAVREVLDLQQHSHGNLKCDFPDPEYREGGTV